MSEPYRLSPDRVEAVFADCLLREGETAEAGVAAAGVVHATLLHRGRLSGHSGEVRAMLGELPEQFHAGTGDGWSFLNACYDRHGEQWTGLHATMERLFQLGEGLGLVKSLLPRELWGVLPGGMPYYVVAAEPLAAGEAVEFG